MYERIVAVYDETGEFFCLICEPYVSSAVVWDNVKYIDLVARWY